MREVGIAFDDGHSVYVRLFYLAPATRDRIITAYPHARLYPSVTISREDLEGFKLQHGDNWWDQLRILLTGLTTEQVLALGGYRVILPGDQIGYEEVPGIPVQV